MKTGRLDTDAPLGAVAELRACEMLLLSGQIEIRPFLVLPLKGTSFSAPPPAIPSNPAATSNRCHFLRDEITGQFSQLAFPPALIRR